jgi:uncharacterized protein
LATVVRCPICKKVVSFGDPNMPFCSERCRWIDLGNWACEKYVIPATHSSSELEEVEENDDSEFSPPGRER